MAYMYKLKDPRGKLRQIVLEYEKKMRVIGLGPNREVTFCDCVPGQPCDTIGWLLDDPRVENVHQRYVLLQDGDVWHESLGRPGNGAAPTSSDRQWLGEPTDDLATLLPKSLFDAQRGGSGFLSDEGGRTDAPLVVGDRRDRQQPFQGADRRRGRA
jgi:hypothetical protein